MKQKRIHIPPESDRVEWKQSLGKWKEIVETCAAFATARGGTIYVGVAFDGTPNGVQIGKGTLEGNLLGQLEESLGFVRRNTRQAIRITGKPEREIVPEYPDEAVREALINALCHRDYASVGTVQVRIFDNRLEVWNPGLLPPDLTIEALYRQHASHPRNPRLAHALYRARLIEHWGTGTLRIIRACEGSNIKVEFLIQAGSFVVRLQKKIPLLIERVGKRVGESLSPKQQEILNLIELNPKISAKSIASKIGISTRKTEDHLRKLRIGSFLRRVGPSRGGHWEVLIR